MYYLQTRYYNPENERFLNADIYVSTGRGLLDSNMFAYCWNNPVIRSDEAGTDPFTQATADDSTPWDDHETLGRLPGGGGGHNPRGRPGSPRHSGKVAEWKEILKSKGISTSQNEPYVQIEGGLKGGRYGDAGILNSNGKLRGILQVGKVNANGTPVAREMAAIYDFNRMGYTVLFVPYNVTNSVYMIFAP